MDFPLIASGSFIGNSIGMAVIENGGSRWNFFLSRLEIEMPGVESYTTNIGLDLAWGLPPISNVRLKKIVLPTQRLINEQEKENLVHPKNNI